MKTRLGKSKAGSSGQLLIVAALAIAVLISSTTIYVYELSKETKSEKGSLSINDFILSLKQNTRKTVISSLANVSNGGEKTVLTSNLNELSQVFRSLTPFGIVDLAFTPLNDSNYDAGIWLSWNTSDIGISSAYTNFTVKVQSMTENITLNYAVNVTTTITISGYYTKLAGEEKLVNLTCNAYNEGKPALAKNVTLFYERLGSWIPVNSSNSFSITDYGNGTYTISFTAEIPSNTVQFSTHVYDLRDIFVLANTTCCEA